MEGGGRQGLCPSIAREGLPEIHRNITAVQLCFCCCCRCCFRGLSLSLPPATVVAASHHYCHFSYCLCHCVAGEGFCCRCCYPLPPRQVKDSVAAATTSRCLLSLPLLYGCRCCRGTRCLIESVIRGREREREKLPR